MKVKIATPLCMGVRSPVWFDFRGKSQLNQTNWFLYIVIQLILIILNNRTELYWFGLVRFFSLQRTSIIKSGALFIHRTIVPQQSYNIATQKNQSTVENPQHRNTKLSKYRNFFLWYLKCIKEKKR